jgi:hypothetical protein
VAIVALVIGFSSSTDSAAVASSPRVTAADRCPSGSIPAGKGCIDAKPVFVERCSARKAIKFYAGRIAYWRHKMGAGSQRPRASVHPVACPRFLAHVLQRKAYAARRAYGRWVEYHYHWQAWLPDKWRRIGICETGLNWQHSNSSYEGAFGFALRSWDSFVPYADRKAGPYPANAYLATPRQQYEVALAIWRRYGLSGWGCRGA